MAGVDDVIRNFEELMEQVEIDLEETLGKIAGDMERAMREGAPWQDRTSLARDGLMAYVDTLNPEHVQEVASNLQARAAENNRVIVLETAEGEEGNLKVTLTGMMSYNEWLEVGHAGQYAIIAPTLEAMGPGALDLLAQVGEL